MLLLTILRRRGFAVDSAKNGAEALERLKQCSYVLMLLDLMMPVVNGWEVLEYLSKLDAAKRPMTIVLTAGSEPRDFNPDLVMGSTHKPFDVDLLVDTVVACIFSGQRAPAASGLSRLGKRSEAGRSPASEGQLRTEDWGLRTE